MELKWWKALVKGERVPGRPAATAAAVAAAQPATQSAEVGRCRLTL
jgi:hypothetical protein